MSLTYKEVAELLKIVDASNLDELVLEIEGIKMHIRRNVSGGQAPALPASNAGRGYELHPAPAEAVLNLPAAGPTKAGIAADQLNGKAVVRSPMVGTFYRAPSPNDPPFVEVGTQVKRGDPLCLIEVMKLFTTLTADQDGCVTHVVPANGDLVEFDQPLFVIEPANP